MSLFVDRSTGVDTSSVTTDLFTISWNDGNLGQGADTTVNGNVGGITSIPAAPVTYTPSVTTGMATADRLFTLVNNNGAGNGLNWGNPIVITALAGGNDPYLGNSINGNGQTYVDTGATPNVIHVVYDTSQDGGQGLALFDTSGNAIQTPNAVILYHELSHAFHNAINQIPFPQTACPGNTTDEPAAEIDENILRTQLGLCLRDVCNHGGESGWGKACGGSATPGGPPLVDGNAPPQNGGCFIVTAVTGSSQAYEIQRLRAIRDRVADRSQVSKDLIAAIYAEYYQFSPEVAVDIVSDAGARDAVRAFVIRPLFAWYELAEMLGMGAANPREVDRATQAVFDACRPEFAPFVVPLLERVLQRESLPETAPKRVLDFGSAIQRASGLPLAAWALLAPLLSAWTCAADRSDLIGAVADWLASAPLDRLDPPPAKSLDAELQQLARFFDFAPEARRRLGGRLAAAWPSTSAVLRCHGFV